MKRNLGSIDRVIRLLLGLIIAGLGYFFLEEVWMWVAVFVGVMIILTSVFGFCSFYTLFGINTCPRKSST